MVPGEGGQSLMSEVPLYGALNVEFFLRHAESSWGRSNEICRPQACGATFWGDSPRFLHPRNVCADACVDAGGNGAADATQIAPII